MDEEDTSVMSDPQPDPGPNLANFGQRILQTIAEKYEVMTANVCSGKQKQTAKKSAKCCGCSYKLCSLFLLVLSLVMTSVAVLIHTQFDSFFNAALKDQMHLGPSGLVFPAWRVSDLRMRMRVYFFNITNPSEVQLGDKPILTEIGPYTWRIYMDKFNINFNDNFTLSYREKKWYEFLPGESVGGYDDIITTVNVPFAAVAQRLKDSGTVARRTATLTLNGIGQTVIHVKRVGELTFEGYPDFLVLVANAVEIGRSEESGLGSIVSAGFRVFTNMLAAEPDVQGSFGYFVDRNNTDDGVITIFTGEDQRSKINEVDVVNGQKELTTWPQKKCNKIKGTMGHIRPPMSGPDRPVTIFVPDMCRSLALRFDKTSVYEGLSTLRFVAGSDTFNNSGPDPCYAGSRHFKNGVMDIGPCKKGAPLVVSFPHYLFADEDHLHSVVGLNPRKELHQFYLEADPLTGVTVSVRARFQVGAVMERVHGLADLGSMFSGTIPLFWQELQLEALPPTIFQLSLLRSLPQYAKQAALGLVGLAILIALSAVFLAYRDWRNARTGGSKITGTMANGDSSMERTYHNHVYENDDEIVKNGVGGGGSHRSSSSAHQEKQAQIRELERRLRPTAHVASNGKSSSS